MKPFFFKGFLSKGLDDLISGEGLMQGDGQGPHGLLSANGHPPDPAAQGDHREKGQG